VLLLLLLTIMMIVVVFVVLSIFANVIENKFSQWHRCQPERQAARKTNRQKDKQTERQ